MIEKITDQNLERYDSRLKEWCDKKFFEKGSYGKYQTTKEAGAVSFYPAPNTPLEGKVKFSFKETPPASGDKSPSNPSAISGVNSIALTQIGRNVFYIPYTNHTLGNVTLTKNNDGSYTLNGQSTLSHDGYTQFQQNLPLAVSSQVLPQGTTFRMKLIYKSGSITKDPDSTRNYAVAIQSTTINVGGGYGYDAVTDVTIEASRSYSGKKYVGSTIIIAGTCNYNNYTFYPIFEFTNSEIATFESTIFNNYTLSLGNTYYGGEIDLATGVMTVTHVIRTVNGTNIKFVDGGETTNYYRLYFPIVYNQPATDRVLDTKCTFIDTAYFGFNTDSEHYYVGTDRVYVFLDKTLPFLSGSGTVVEKANAYAAQMVQGGTPWSVTYKLATPYTVQLDPLQLTVLTQKDKYTPRLNTVYTDADSVQISYLKSPIRDEYEKTQAILSLGGNS